MLEDGALLSLGDQSKSDRLYLEESPSMRTRKVEERLRGEGMTRYDLGREKFLDKVWEWKDEYATTIKEQWGKMGLSVDYSRERFTLDEGLSKAVRKVFVDLYKKYSSQKIFSIL